eukprot:scaffold262207_cov15-Tisochrysis_lutea.AAC.1
MNQQTHSLPHSPPHLHFTHVMQQTGKLCLWVRWEGAGSDLRPTCRNKDKQARDAHNACGKQGDGFGLNDEAATTNSKATCSAYFAPHPLLQSRA